jgi:hypothetical protein
MVLPAARDYEAVRRVTGAAAAQRRLFGTIAARTVVNTNQPLLVLACCGGLLLAAGCAPKQEAAKPVGDLMDDRVALDGLLMKCNQPPGDAADVSCGNAHIASERLARQAEAAQEAKRAQEFERNREKLREADEQRRQTEEARKVDAYHLPVVPVEPPPASGEPVKPDQH